jgi:protein-ribulosamine 3-kinase
MNINSDIQNKIENHLKEKIVSANPVSGGCIAESSIIKTESNKFYFLKTHSGRESMFLKEANGLMELAKPKAIRIPQVVLANENFLLLENIEQGSKTSRFFEEFGLAFSKMHRHTYNSFGFYEDNYIGTTPQFNLAKDKEKTNWTEFYYQKRILPQLRFAEKNGYATSELTKGVSILEDKIETILMGSDEAPSLLHGDLWGGNYLCDSSGHAVLIDPAVYYGHREADLAMTKMFGGFSPSFYNSYMEAFPLPFGWEYREGLYLLYHYMNHLNLFGRMYYGECIKLLWSYLK